MLYLCFCGFVVSLERLVREYVELNSVPLSARGEECGKFKTCV